MKLFEPGTFHYLNDKLYCEHKSVDEIIEETGTPAYIYSKKFFQESYTAFDDAFAGIKHTIFFAAKSNFNLKVMKVFADMGAGVDVNSAGELYRAQKAGVHPSKILFSGVGKTAKEIKLAIEYDVKLIKAESVEEIELINKIAEGLDTTARVAIRINPDVDAMTHPYISTGLAENKFGIDASEAVDVYRRCAQLGNIVLTGIDMHIGSQITSISPFVEAVGKMAKLYKKIKEYGIPLEHFDMGGGMGVRYNQEEVFSPIQLADAVRDVLSGLDCEIMFEPGRYLTANGGILVAEVLYTKKNREKNFIITDASMTELIRPGLYKAYHHVQPVVLKGRQSIHADIVGPVCESSDFLAKDRDIESVEAGDRLAIMTAGAYGMVMSSNYNGRRRPPEILVDGDKYTIARSRETYEHMLWDEEI